MTADNRPRATQLISEKDLYIEVVSAMPSDISAMFEARDSEIVPMYIMTMVSQFSRNSSPSWFAQLPASAQTYFMTRYMRFFEDNYDIHGTSWTSILGLKLTTPSDSVPITTVDTLSLRYVSAFLVLSDAND